ncbi:MAG: outer membrane beta-barrel domain-containing protein [Bacteriovoracaceae bacterium]|jgi:outer membrane beta-barrel protein|nr:outer membrane beta-barrel domain-containing protein [Bacteriovoracaceae bacterium]
MVTIRFVLPMALLLFFSTPLFGAEDNLYDFLWLDPDKSVYVLQNKVYAKKNKFYLNLGGVKGFSSRFQSTYGIHGNVGYNFAEEWGFELFVNNYDNSNNTDYNNVKAINSSEPFVRRLNTIYGGMLTWSPFYGKINTFNEIIYFDWHFGVGPSKVHAESNINTVTDPTVSSRYEKEDYMGVTTRTGVKIYISKSIHMGVDLMNTNYKAPGPRSKAKKKLRSNFDGILSLGFSF